MIKYVTEHVPYYKRYKGIEDIQELPVINKAEIKRNYKDFLSEEYEDQVLKTLKTSGSTGEPFVRYVESEKMMRRIAEVIYFNQLTGFEVGDKHALVSINKKGKLQCILQNQSVIDPQYLEEIDLYQTFNVLDKKRTKVIVGYPSTIEAMALAVYKNSGLQTDSSVKIVIATGEPLDENARNKIESIMGCKVCARYAANELGVIGGEKNKGEYLLNSSNYFIEVLDPLTNEQVRPGEIGKVVITDLSSFAMPLIRYDIGDIATFKNEEAGCLITDLQGRSNDRVITPNGQVVSPFKVNQVIKYQSEINRFQFIQENDSTYQINVEIGESKNVKEIRYRVIKEYKKLLGEEANINFQVMEKIPTLASGKTTFIKNNYINNEEANV